MPALPVIIGISATLCIGGILVSWIFNTLTEEQKRKQKELEEQIEKIKAEIERLYKSHEKIRTNSLKNFFKDVSDIYLKYINEFRQEKLNIKRQLTSLEKEVHQRIASPYSSPYLVSSLKRELILLEDARRRLDAYFEYLDWIEAHLRLYEHTKEYQRILNLEPPSPLLPDDWLYVGKLVLLESEEELKKPNRFNQILDLLWVSRAGQFQRTPEPELEALRSHQTDIPVLIVQEYRKAIDQNPETEYEQRFLRYRKFFCSVLKGELLYYHILRNTPFLVRPFDENPHKEVNYYYYKDVIKCKMKRSNKKYYFKKYSSHDEIYVYPLESDLLLRDLWVSEIKPDTEFSTSDYICIVFERQDDLKEVSGLNLSEDVKVSVSGHPDLNERKITLRVFDLNLHCTIMDDHLRVVEKSSGHVEESFTIELPFNFTFVDAQQFSELRQFLIQPARRIEELLIFIQQELDYLSKITTEEGKQYEFILKWEKIIDRQIELEAFTIHQLSFSTIEKGKEEIVINISDVQQLNELLEKIQNEMIKRKRDLLIRCGFRVKLEKQSKSHIIFIGDVMDIDSTTKKIRVKPHEASSEEEIKRILDELKDNIVYLAVENPLSHLYRQKKALVKFNRGEMVNKDLKKYLIIPDLLKNLHIPDKIEHLLSKIEWKNPNLTGNQMEVVIKALTRWPIFLVLGPPGSGKTTTIKEIVYQYLKNNPSARVLIVSQQNVAVDNALIRIYRENYEEWFKENIKSIVRIAPIPTKVDEHVKSFTIESWFEKYKEKVKKNSEYFSKTGDHKKLELLQLWLKLIDHDDISKIDPDILDVLISSHNIIGATCVGFANKRIGLERVSFDLVIIDEAARATPPELLIPILRAKKVVLIGDHYQLPPVISRSILDDLEESGELDPLVRDLLEKSFFEKIYEETPDTHKEMLLEQFRMPAEIGNLISKLFYDGRLRNGIIKSTDDFVEKRVIRWIDIPGSCVKEGTSRYNLSEAIAIRDLLLDIQNKLGDQRRKSVAIITPYSAQKRLLKSVIDRLREEGKVPSLEIKCDTVDSFQGQEADIVIYSSVRTQGKIDFILDRRRLNVAISRTRENLYFVGHLNFLYNAEVVGRRNYYREIVDYIRELYGTL